MSEQGPNPTAYCACPSCLHAGQQIIHLAPAEPLQWVSLCLHIPTGPRWLPLQHLISVAFRSWLYDLCRGIDDEPVKNRHLPQSIGCSKNFPGKSALATQKEVGKINVLQKETQLLDW